MLDIRWTRLYQRLAIRSEKKTTNSSELRILVTQRKLADTLGLRHFSPGHSPPGLFPSGLFPRRKCK